MESDLLRKYDKMQEASRGQRPQTPNQTKSKDKNQKEEKKEEGFFDKMKRKLFGKNDEEKKK